MNGRDAQGRFAKVNSFKYVLGTQPLVTLNQHNKEPVHLNINWDIAQNVIDTLQEGEKVT